MTISNNQKESKIWLNKRNLYYNNSILHSGKWNIFNIAEKFGTPLFITNLNVIENRYKAIFNAFKTKYSNFEIHYAVKANSNISILRKLNKLGSSVDCVSIGEIYLCQKAGFSSDRIIYTGNNYTNEEITFAVTNKVSLNLDAITQLDRLNTIISENNVSLPRISFRVNPEFGAGHHEHCITAGNHVKFGLFEDQIVQGYSKALEYGFNRFGIHMHIGSGILNLDPLHKSMDKLAEILKDIKEKLDIQFEFIDIGGGYGIPYNPMQNHLNISKTADFITNKFCKICNNLDLGNPCLKIEPGRYIVGESTIIVTQINTIKHNQYKNYIGINTGFNTLIRPAFYDSYHEIIPIKLEQPDLRSNNNSISYDIVGPICESGDVLGKNREFKSKIRENDYLAILDTGAYGYSMSSNYNSRLKPAEILLYDQHEPVVIREKQKFEDLLMYQNFPDYLRT